MLAGAVNDLLDHLAAVGVPKPEYVMDTVEPGWSQEANTLFLRQQDDMNRTARAALSYLFAIGQELPPEVQQAALDVLLPHLTIRCRSFRREGRGGKPACVAVIGFPSFCGTCYSPTGVG